MPVTLPSHSELRGHLTHFRQSQFQLLCPLDRFAAGLLPLQATADAAFEFRDELVGAERAARASRVAQHGEDGEVRFSLDRIGETTEALDERRDTRQPIVASGEMRAGARPPDPAPEPLEHFPAKCEVRTSRKLGLLPPPT